MKIPAARHLLVLLLFPLAVGIASTAAAEEFDVPLTIDTDHLVLTNLIGEITLDGYGGSSFEVEVHVRGGDADPERIQVSVNEGDPAEVLVEFPLEDEARFVYPRLGRGSNTTFQLRERGHRDASLLDRMVGTLRGRRIRVSGSGRGLEVWADVTVKVPAGRKVRVGLGVGEIKAANAEVDLVLDTHTGPVRVSHIEGNLVIDTGSGEVEGNDLKGDISIDTGSGHVTLERCEGGSVNIDTGSGHVGLEEIACSNLGVDTGSGRVRARAVEADEVLIDTGSGSIVLELVEMGDGRFALDTGSGSIDLRLPAAASANVMAETGSGRIRLDLDDPVRLRRRGDDEVAFRIGDGGAHVYLDTGSGSITVSQ